MNQIILNEGNRLIKAGSLWKLKRYYKSYHKDKAEAGYHNDSYFFQKWFTHACSWRQFSIAKWLYKEMYLKFDPMTQTGVRHTFNYCKVTMDGKNHPKFKAWLVKIVEENQKKFAPKK